MKPIIPLLVLVLLSPLPVVAQTPATPSNTTGIQSENAGPPSSVTSTTSVPGNPQTTVTRSKREDGSTTIIALQPQSAYQPMGQGGYQPMGRC